MILAILQRVSIFNNIPSCLFVKYIDPDVKSRMKMQLEQRRHILKKIDLISNWACNNVPTSQYTILLAKMLIRVYIVSPDVCVKRSML